jgi:hypothetical protein
MEYDRFFIQNTSKLFFKDFSLNKIIHLSEIMKEILKF